MALHSLSCRFLCIPCRHPVTRRSDRPEELWPRGWASASVRWAAPSCWTHVRLSLPPRPGQGLSPWLSGFLIQTASPFWLCPGRRLGWSQTRSTASPSLLGRRRASGRSPRRTPDALHPQPAATSLSSWSSRSRTAPPWVHPNVPHVRSPKTAFLSSSHHVIDVLKDKYGCAGRGFPYEVKFS